MTTAGELKDQGNAFFAKREYMDALEMAACDPALNAWPRFVDLTLANNDPNELGWMLEEAKDSEGPGKKSGRDVLMAVEHPGHTGPRFESKQLSAGLRPSYLPDKFVTPAEVERKRERRACRACQTRFQDDGSGRVTMRFGGEADVRARLQCGPGDQVMPE
ncbi:hypothetical protein FA95DRAFT_1575458 [Auriscalpium vulgare]|uniref:Uncharacterized protein n=1 Tax=Auriscalpium vulgare TaxID=40419 RepID=A0ACB8RGZ6_9AGAM|nr:hypothetical protein FA95DRAFT_1575458 [Auriscalpium vulgare]